MWSYRLLKAEKARAKKSKIVIIIKNAPIVIGVFLFRKI